MASFQVTPPDQFDFNKPADFEKWFVRFERFKTAICSIQSCSFLLVTG